jgi:hypothetical protein
MSWYSASHVKLAAYRHNEDLSTWDWTDQKLWDWQGGEVIGHAPLSLFNSLKEFDFVPTRSLSKQVEKGSAGL